MTTDLPKLWLTRSLPAAYKSAEVWARAGCACAISPLLTIVPAKAAPPPPPKNATLIFTSGNGLRFFVDYSDYRGHKIITVGDVTAKAAREAGFDDVISADGTSHDVTEYCLGHLPKDVPVIHCAGAHIRGSVTEDLRAAGYQARRDIYYQTEPAEKLPKLDISQLSYIALYSPLAAKTLASFQPDLSGLTTLSISAATDAELGDMPARRLIAAAPNEAAMLALLRQG